MELKDTIELMQSDDYKERFMAEHQQLIIRYKKQGQQSSRYPCGNARQNSVTVVCDS